MGINNIINKYNIKIDSINNFNNRSNVPAIMNFLNEWKNRTYNWYKNQIEEYINLHNKEGEAFKEYSLNNNGSKDYSTFRREYYGCMLNNIVLDFAYNNRNMDRVDLSRLDRVLESEKIAKYNDLIARVTKITGEIADATNLSIGNQKGELNGIIAGSKGKVRIETIGAGGYNEDEIVNYKHGQCFHYRVLIHKL